MDAFLTKKRPLADVDTNNNNLPASPPSSSLSQSSLPPTKKAKTAAKVSDSSAKPPRAKKAPAKPKAAKTIGHCSLNKKEFGDRIKDCLALEKYEVQRMSFKMKMDVASFKDFFGDKGIEITPQVYDETTPIVVAELGNKEAGEVFGVSKIKNGNRYTTINLARMCVVLHPPKKVATAWVSA